MAVLKKIAKLSDKEAKTREAQFEAEMLALVAQGGPPKPAAPSVVGAVSNRDPSLSSSAPTVEGIRISVTTNGQTIDYHNLESVPGPIRQQILNAWIVAPAASVPPMLNAPALPSPAAPSPKAMKVAMFLNLMIPGAGQFYFGQRLAGAVYALAFFASFIATLIIFLHGYLQYLKLSTSGDIMESANLEQIAHAFPIGIIAALSVIGIVIYLASTIHLALSRPRPAK